MHGDLLICNFLVEHYCAANRVVTITRLYAFSDRDTCSVSIVALTSVCFSGHATVVLAEITIATYPVFCRPKMIKVRE